MDEILCRAEQRRRQALAVLEELDLLGRWSRYGRPFLLGAVKFGLVVNRDIDLNIYSDHPRIDQGFKLMSEIAVLPGVLKIRYSNKLETPDQGLYWQIQYQDKRGDVWKIDNWFVSEGQYAGWGEAFAERMQESLTTEKRQIILQIKEFMQGNPEVRGIDIYKAVLEDGIRSPSEFTTWMQENKSPDLGAISEWMPSAESHDSTKTLIRSEKKD